MLRSGLISTVVLLTSACATSGLAPFALDDNEQKILKEYNDVRTCLFKKEKPIVWATWGDLEYLFGSASGLVAAFAGSAGFAGAFGAGAAAAKYFSDNNKYTLARAGLEGLYNDYVEKKKNGGDFYKALEFLALSLKGSSLDCAQP
jgi:hypothetical protein